MNSLSFQMCDQTNATVQHKSHYCAGSSVTYACNVLKIDSLLN